MIEYTPQPTEEEVLAAKKEQELMQKLQNVSTAMELQTEEISKLCISLEEKEQELSTNHALNTKMAAGIIEKVIEHLNISDTEVQYRSVF